MTDDPFKALIDRLNFVLEVRPMSYGTAIDIRELRDHVREFRANYGNFDYEVRRWERETARAHMQAQKQAESERDEAIREKDKLE